MTHRALSSAALAALLGGVLIAASPAAHRVSASNSTYWQEAEAMTLTGAAKTYNDSSASGGKAVAAYTNGDGVSGSASFATSGTYTFTFGAHEDYYGAGTGTHAHIALYLDSSSTPATGVYVTTTSGYAAYAIATAVSAGTHSFKLVFDNDAWGGSSSTDRNAYIDYVSVAPSADPATATDTPAPATATDTPAPAAATATPAPAIAPSVPPPPSYSGTAYYVDCSSSASDSNSGTSPSSPWRSLSKASSAPLGAGNALLFKRGCSWTGTLIVSHSGSSSQNIVVGAYGSGALPLLQTSATGHGIVTLSGAYITVDSLAVKALAPSRDAGCQNVAVGWLPGFDLGSHDDTIQNSTASYGWAGVNVEQGATHNHIIYDQLLNNNMMYPDDRGGNYNDAGAFGVALHGDDTEVAHTTISGSHACSYDFGQDGSAVEVYGGQYNTMDYNTAVDDLNFSELGNSRSLDNTYAYNFYRSSLANSDFVTTRGSKSGLGPIYGTTLYNNTIYLTGSGSQGFSCDAGCNSSILKMRNNVIQAVWKGGYADAPFNEDYDLYWQGATNQVYMGAHSKVANPLFVAPGSDFRLQQSSPAVNSGTSLSYTRDLGDSPVPVGGATDMGAYEYQG